MPSLVKISHLDLEEKYKFLKMYKNKDEQMDKMRLERLTSAQVKHTVKTCFETWTDNKLCYSNSKINIAAEEYSKHFYEIDISEYSRHMDI